MKKHNSAEMQSIYRLGQMDMQHAAVDLLSNLADNTQGISRSTLLGAAQMIRNLSVCEPVKDGADGDT